MYYIKSQWKNDEGGFKQKQFSTRNKNERKIEIGNKLNAPPLRGNRYQRKTQKLLKK